MRLPDSLDYVTQVAIAGRIRQLCSVFAGPLGAFICAWGGFTMITSAPFDDWWHNAYGLDVKILSPPHVLLAIGMVAVEIGALVLIAARMNRASGKSRRGLGMAVSLCSQHDSGGAAGAGSGIHSSHFSPHRFCYRSICILTPIVLAIASRATGMRWAATIVTAIYTAVLLGLLWICRCFPAQPKLGPVLHEVTQFIPSGFPLLVLIPAFVLDLVWPHMAGWSKWQQALVSGALFLVVLVAVEWPFADFLQSPAARNALFGSIYYDYNQSPQGYAATYRFVPFETTSQFRSGMAIALGCSIVSMWLGMSAGDWLKRVRR